MNPVLEALIAAMLVTGGSFALIGSFGLAKLSDFYKRLHGPTKATTLGVGGVLIASSLFITATTGALSAHEFLISLFLFMTAPVSAHLLVKAALRLDAQAADGASQPRPADGRTGPGEPASR